MFVEEILQKKGHDVLTIRPTASVREAVRRLSLERVGALIVSEDGERLQGIISERDVILSLARRGANLLDERVSDVMMQSVPTCAPDDKLKSVMAVMTQKRARHMPVLERGRLCGIVSIGDIVKHRLEDLELKSAVMRDAYIMQGSSKSP
jgi:CBS domain-containing protein